MTNLFSNASNGGWLGIGDSIRGIGFGLLLFLASFLVLFLNEARAVRTARSLAEGAKIVINVDADAVNPKNEGKLVHLAGLADTNETLHDSLFQMSAKALKLHRNVTMYQWIEQKKANGNGDDSSTYSYVKEWSPAWQDSSKFKQPTDHVNPAPAVESQNFVANRVKIGAFQLSPGLVKQIQDAQPLAVPADAPEQLHDGYKRFGEGYYRGANPDTPAVGDLKVTFTQVKPQQVSVVAQQSGNGLAPYATKAGATLEMLRPGLHSSPDMFQSAEHDNANLTWGLRFTGFILMWFGMGMVAAPIRQLANLIPFLGSLVGAAMGIVTGLAAIALSTLTIALAWIVFRPLLGMGLLFGALALAWAAWAFLQKWHQKKLAAA